ncbi:MAG: hypothetical protein ACP5UB_00935 [Candidatus Sumerlaeaceae bacterium]
MCWICAGLAGFVTAVAPHRGLALLFLFASGVPLAALLRRKYFLTEFFAVTVGCALVVLTLSAAISIILGIFASRSALMLPAVLAFLAGVRLRGAQIELCCARRDLAAAGVGAIVLAAASFVYLSNGPVATPRGYAYIMRHWLARDGAYLFGLVQEALERRSYPDENPFMAGVPNSYASLGHCGLGLLCTAEGEIAAFALWPYGIFFHVAAAMLLAHTMARGSRAKTQQTRWDWVLLAAAALVAWRADFFVYPQSQSYFLPVLSLFLWWTSQRGWWKLSAARNMALGGALVLTSVHTVSAAVALCVLVGATFGQWRSLWTWPLASQSLWLSGLLIALSSFWFFGGTPYGPRLSAPTSLALEQLQKHALPYLPLYILVGWGTFAAWRRRDYLVSSALGLLGGLAMLYTLVGIMSVDPFSVFFAIFNAQRLPYFASVVALAYLLGLSNVARVAAVLLAVLPLIFFPSPLLRETWNLVLAPPLVFTPSDIHAYHFIREETPPRARFLSNAEHWGLATFTGRTEFARGPVPAFGLHTVPEDEAYRLFALREAFLQGQHMQELWRVLHDRFRIEYVLLEHAKAKSTSEFAQRLAMLEWRGMRFVVEFDSSQTVLFHWTRQDDEPQANP